MATINITAKDTDIININVVGSEKETLCDELYNRLREALIRKSNKAKHHFWYEVFIDFSEDFDEELYPLVKNLPYQAAFDLCWGWLARRDEYYGSPRYTKDLDNMLKNSI